MSKIYEVEKGLADTLVNARSINNSIKSQSRTRFVLVKQEAFIDWEEKWDQISRTNMKEGRLHGLGAKLNVAQNWIDTFKLNPKTAIIWEGDNPNEQENISYKELRAVYVD